MPVPGGWLPAGIGLGLDRVPDRRAQVLSGRWLGVRCSFGRAAMPV